MTTEDAGHSWAKLSRPSNTAFTSCCIDAGSYVYIFGDDGESYRRPHAITDINNDKPRQSAAAIDIYPHPLEDHSVLRLALPVEAEARLHIFDVRGRQVLGIAATTGDIDLHRRDFQAGVYLFQLVNKTRVVEQGRFVVR